MSDPHDRSRSFVLVTGASRGIGEAVARALAAAGHHAIVAARSTDDLERVAGEIAGAGGAATAIALDVADPASIAAAAERVEAIAGGALDALVNNAGIAHAAPLLPKPGRPGPDYEAHLAVNFHGPRRLVEAFAPAMIARGGGAVVNVASSAALVGYPYVAAYCASKHALLGYARSAALETAARGLRWYAVCPHYVDSPMLAASVERVVAATGRTHDEAREHFAASNPSGRLVRVDEVAGLVRDAVAGTRATGVYELDGANTTLVEAWESDAKVR